MTGIDAGKSVLRRQYKDMRRLYIGKADAPSARTALRENLQKLIADLAAEQTCLYRARPEEAPCQLNPVTDFYYPALEGQEISFYRPSSPSAFTVGPFGIEEPKREGSASLVLGRSTVVFAPAVAVDADGIRLGMGRGYYDRFFASHSDVVRVGVVYHFQFSPDRLPAESWDEPVDWIVSEKMILRTFAKRSS